MTCEVDVGVDLKYEREPASDDDLVDIDVKDDGEVKIDTLLAAGGDISHDIGDGIMKDILNNSDFGGGNDNAFVISQVATMYDDDKLESAYVQKQRHRSTRT